MSPRENPEGIREERRETRESLEGMIVRFCAKDITKKRNNKGKQEDSRNSFGRKAKNYLDDSSTDLA